MLEGAWGPGTANRTCVLSLEINIKHEKGIQFRKTARLQESHFFHESVRLAHIINEHKHVVAKGEENCAEPL